MSYQAYVSFKELEPENICSFFSQLKKTAIEHLHDIAEAEWKYDPMNKRYFLPDDEYVVAKRTEKDRYNKSRLWFFRDVFSYRWCYIQEHRIIAVFGVPDALRQCFDGTVFFQDFTDQNYDLTQYSGIRLFEELYQTILNEDRDVFHDLVKDRYPALEEESEEYCRKQYVYDEIFGLVKDCFNDDDKATYIALFNQWDIKPETSFLKKCFEIAKEQRTTKYLKGEGHV